MEIAIVTAPSMKESIREVHEKLEREAIASLFIKGWAVWREESSCFFVKKIAFVAGSIFSVLYVSASAGAGVLALLEAKSELQDGSQYAPIIGHFSEWTMLGVFSSMVFLQVPYYIAEKGWRHMAEELFSNMSRESHWSEEEVFQIEEERQRVVYPEDSVHAFRWDLVSLGFQHIGQRKGERAESSLKIALIVSFFLFLGQAANYCFGVIGSGVRAWDDYQEGKNPSIVGHSFEWAAEIVGAAGILFSAVSEIARIGKAVELSRQFNEQISKCTCERQKKRLEQQRDEKIFSLPQGYLFRIPYSSRFE